MLTGRFAPTPSGRLHLGNLLCALLSYLAIRSQGGRFLLRIEDVDIPRCPRRAGEQCIEDLAWLGLRWDEEPLWQSERGDIYARYLDILREKGLAYPCFCTRARLHQAAAPNLGDTQFVYDGACASLTAEEIRQLSKQRSPAMRVRVPDEDVTFTDLLQGEYSENLQRDCGDFIVQRSDGLWGYQLAVVVDDALSGVNQVVRGRDILSATPRQIYLQRVLGFDTPEYLHIPLLTDWAGRRLAKRDKDLDLTELTRRYTREQLLGILAYAAGLLEEARPMKMESLIALYDPTRIRREDMRLPKDLTV